MQSPDAGLSTDSFLSNSVQLAHGLLIDILHAINSLGPYTLDLEPIWNHTIAELSVKISSFVEITSLTSKVIMTKTGQSLTDVKESHINLLFIMKAMILAEQKQDPIAMEELIKYELKDNLTQWKIDLIPQMKRLLSNYPSI